MNDVVEKLARVLKQQNATNCIMAGENWIERRLPFYRKCWREASEMLDHLNDDWWKNRPVSVLHVKMELVDIFHFMLSDAIVGFVNNRDDEDEPIILDDAAFMTLATRLWAEWQMASRTTHTPYGELDLHDTDDRSIMVDAIEDYIVETIHDKNYYGSTFEQDCLSTFISLARRLGFDTEDAPALLTLTNWYIAKAALNAFRQAKGDKQGTYQKIWAGVEDNHYLFAVLEEGFDQMTFDEAYEYVYSYLDDMYQKVTS